MIEENERLDKQAQRRLREVTTLYEASQACLSISDQRGLLTAIIEAAARATDAVLGSVMLVDEKKGEYIFGAHYGLSEETIAAIEAELHIPLGEGLVGAVVTTGQPVVVADVRTDPRWIPTETKELMRSFLGVPLVGRDGQPLGALTLSRPDVGAFDEDHVRLLSTFANQAAMAIENARLYERARQEIAERKRAIEALRGSEERYRRLVELSFDAIAVHREGKIVYINAAGAELLGASSPEEIVGKPILDFVHPDYSEIAKARVLQTMKGRVAPLIEEKLIQLDGTSVDAEVMEIPITYQGQPAVQVVVRNITERKRAEEALRKSETLFHSLIESLPQNIFSKDLEGRVTFANQRYCMTEGKSLTDILGKTDFDLHPPELAKKYREDDRRVIETDQIFETVEEHQPMGGDRFYVQVIKTPVYDSNGQVTGVLGIFWDITERKRAEEALAHERDLLSALMDSIPDTIYFKDTACRFTRINRAQAHVLGVNPEEAIGKTDFDFFTAEHARGAYTDEQGIVKSGQPLVDKVERIRRADGQFRWVSATKVPIMDKEGQVTGIVGISRDITERKQAEEALAYERDLLHALMDNVPDTIYFKDAASRFTKINRAQAQVLGVDPEEAIGKTDFDFFTAEHARDAYADEQEIVESGQPLIDKVERIRRANGQFRWVSATKVPITDKEGRVTGIVGISRDITERKRAEEELRWLKEFNEGMVQSMTEGIIVENAEGCLTFVNPSGAALLGYTPDELLGQHWTVVVPPDQKPIIQAAHERRAWGEADRYDVEFIRRDGTRVPVLISGSPRFEEGRFAGTLAVFTDITERKQAEEALRESEERYRALYEDNPSMYFTVDTEGTVLSVNRFGAEQLGYTVEELVGQSVLNVFYRDDEKAALQQLAMCMQNPTEIARWEFRKVRKDGSVLWVKEAARTVRSTDGKTVVLIVCEDITERKKLEEQLRQAQKIEAIGQLAGGIAHDFNNLLTPISGFAELLLWKAPEGSQQHEYLRQIKIAAERAAALTRQLLAFARRAQVEVRPLSLNDVAREVIELLERTIDKAIAIEPYLADDLAIVEGDASQLHQVLLNLCLNARDAMPDGGQLIIETQNVTLSEAKARTELDLGAGQYVLLSVTDTGIGMDAKAQQHLFEPFFTTKEQGRGLGLAMVYGIVRGHGGTIHVYTEPGHGSTFKVYLPVARRLAEDTVPKEAEVVGGTETILVVDDEEPVRALLQSILEGGGYTVLLATDGVEATELYTQRSTEIDLVVLDIIMPRMAGRRTYERLREINPEVRVLLSSGYSENGQAQDILAAGAKGFLQKPYDLRAVLRKVREVLED